MILIAHKTQAADQEARPRFWIDAREEAALAAAVYERFDSEQPESTSSRRADAAPELTTCYNDSHE